MKRLVHNARVLVIDGAKGRVLRNDGDVAAPSLTMVRSYEQANPATREQGSERPGRTRVDATRRAAVETTDWHDVAEAEFVTSVAADLDRDLRAGAFDSIVVIAAPAALGVYRRAATPALRAATVHEVAKDLVHHTNAEIAGVVAKALGDAT